MYARNISHEIIAIAQQYPVVGVMGPRQSGKTTLVTECFKEKPYANLEAPDIRSLAQNDPRRFLEKYPNGAILDEIQRVPELLSYIQVIVDQKNTKGMFIITGSHQMALHEAVSQSLAGRIGLLMLYPLTLDELRKANKELTLNAQILHGFYPRIYQDNLDPMKTYSNYVQTYIEKDIRKISAIKDIMLFQKFLKLCAGRIGKIVDYSSLSNEVGVSSNTIKHWIAILEASYLIFRLPPYFDNFGKRLIKSPKLYFTDVGLASYLLDIETITQIERDPLRGYLIENLIIAELMKYRYNLGLQPNLYYYRDSNQNEVDVILKRGHELIPIEIKSAQTYTRGFIRGLNYFKKIAKDRVSKSYLIYCGEEEQIIQDVSLINYKNAIKIYQE